MVDSKDTSPKSGTQDAKDQKKEIEKAHQAQGRPVSPTDDPTDHSLPATQLAAQVDPKKESGATVNAKSMDAMNRADEAAEDKERLDDDQSIGGKLRRSGLFFVRDHTTGEDYVGISPAADPNASYASKTRSLVQPLDLVSPRTGMVVRPKDGDAFTIPEGFGPDSNPGRWAEVRNPTSNEPLFA